MLHTGSSKEYKQELKANKGCRTETLVSAVIPALFVPWGNCAALLLCHRSDPHVPGTFVAGCLVCTSDINHRAFFKVRDSLGAGCRPKRRMSSHTWVKLVMGRVFSEIMGMIYSQASTYCYAILINPLLRPQLCVKPAEKE